MNSKEEWAMLVARTIPSHIPVLPKTTLDDLTPAGREKVLTLYRSKHWKFCLACWRSADEYVLKKCGGCGVFRGQYVLYCSRKCQRKEWASHKELCADVVSRSTRLAIDAGVPLYIWQNISRLTLKRREGMRTILVWAFDQVCMNNTSLDLKNTCLSVFCRSYRDGKGPIRLESFQLRPLADSRWGTKPFGMANYMRSGVVYVYIDGVCLDANVLPLDDPPNPESYMPQWPWIFGTLLAMQNHNGELAAIRLELLLPYVERLVDARKLDILQFVAPPGLGGGIRWHPYKFEEWQSIFSHCIDV